jgi:hypothetical protein
MIKNKNIFLFGSVILVALAIPLVSILGRIGSSSTTGDVRARASATNALQMNGTVSSIHEIDGTLVVDNIYLADESRAGDAKSLGSWTVTAPGGFNFASVSLGQPIVMGIDAETFLAETHTVTALSITPVTR